MDEIYEAWKPIRNFLRRTDPKIALETIRYYSLYSGTPGEHPPDPPSYIEVHPSIISRSVIGIFPWDMEVLAREVIYSASLNGSNNEHDLRQWRYFGNLMEKLRYLENTISRLHINQDNILLELFRISHRQFPHQGSTLNRDDIVRYGKLFCYPEVAPIVLDRVGLPYEKILSIGVMYWGLFEQYAAIEHPTEGFAGTNISQDDLEHFLNLFSKSFDEIKELVSSVHAVDNTFLYQYSPLTAYPLVRFEENDRVTHVCSSVNRFCFQITKGIYYMLYSDQRFDNAFGNAFESYIGEVLQTTQGGAEVYTIFSQETDQSEGKRRCDWIIDQGEEFVMIECKTKRMAMGGYTLLDDISILDEQLNILAEAVVQTYEGYLVYRNQGYTPPVYNYSPNKSGAICVVTLENWYLYGPNLEKLKDIVRTKLNDKRIDTELIETVPYEVIGASDLEKLAYLAKEGHSIREIFNTHINGSEATHEFATFIKDHYTEQLGDYKHCLSDDLDLYLTPGPQAAA